MMCECAAWYVYAGMERQDHVGCAKANLLRVCVRGPGVICRRLSRTRALSLSLSLNHGELEAVAAELVSECVCMCVVWGYACRLTRVCDVCNVPALPFSTGVFAGFEGPGYSMSGVYVYMCEGCGVCVLFDRYMQPSRDWTCGHIYVRWV